MSTAPCYTDLPVVKRSYASDNGSCGKTEYLKPVGEFTAGFSVGCTGLTGTAGLLTFKNVKLRSTVPTNQLVTFYVDIKFSQDNGVGPALFGGTHLNNVPVYANVSYGFDNKALGLAYTDVAYYTLHLVYNEYLNAAVGDLTNKVNTVKLFVKKGSQIYAGIH